MSELNSDLLDEGLQNVMGKDRCQNPEDWQKKTEKSPVEGMKTRKEKAVDAQWEPVKPKPNYMDKLKACAKDSLMFCALSLLFFYWQQTGQMAMSASMPSICVCLALLGFRVGKAFGER